MTEVNLSVPPVARLKEADAFQRLVFDMVAIPERGASASKKQTPFSVWYAPLPRTHLRLGNGLKEADAFQRLVLTDERTLIIEVVVPQRSRRLSASGMTPASWGRQATTGCLKEADAFQRLVSGRLRRPAARSSGLKEADAFQRLVSTGSAKSSGTSTGLKEADAFQRLVCPL